MDIEKQGKSKSVAVIGAGASGLISIYELRRQGHRVQCFESEEEIGGTWNVHSTRTSMYYSLRTNLPR